MTMTIELRPYQIEAIASVRQHFAAGRKKVLLHMPTGSGKGIVLAEIMRLTHERGNRCLFVVRGRELVKQGANRCRVPHGIIMAGMPEDTANVMVASIDTLYSRRHSPDVQLVVIDEVHMCGGESYEWLAAQYPEAYMLGVTASPYQCGSISHLCQEIVAPIGYQDLVQLGNLVPSRTFAPHKIDRKSIKKNGGEFSTTESDNQMRKRVIVGNTVEQYAALGEDRSAICFCVTKAHAAEVCQAFISRGITSAVITADTPDDERKAVIEGSKSGAYRVICNVMVLSVGVDMPWVSCIISARPTCSDVLWVQMLGRGSRPYPGKKDFLVLDQAGNTDELGFIEEKREASVNGYTKKKSTKGVVRARTCKKCFATVAADMESCCPYCKTPWPVKLIRREDGTLVEMTEKKIITLSEDVGKAVQYANYLRSFARQNGYAHGWVYFRLKARYSERVVRQVLREA